jgi:hypothetical protein
MADRIDEQSYVNQNGTVTQWSLALMITDNTTADLDTALEIARAIVVLTTTHTIWPIVSNEGR